MEDMETLNLHTHSRLSAHEGRGRVPPPSQSTKVKIKAIIHNSERLRSILSLCLLPFKCVKGRVRTFFFFLFVATESPLRVEVKQWLRSRAVQIVCTWGLRWPCRSTTQQNNHPTNPQCKIWPLGIRTKKRFASPVFQLGPAGRYIPRHVAVVHDSPFDTLSQKILQKHQWSTWMLQVQGKNLNMTWHEPLKQ